MVWSSPAVANGVVYIGSGDTKLYAFDALTGAMKWQFPTGGFVDSSPAVANGIVYVGSGGMESGSYLYAIDATTGTEMWQFKINNSTIRSSPAVANGVVYVGSDNINYFHGRLYAIGQAPAGQGGQASPSPTKSPGFVVLLTVLAIAGVLFLIRR
ncbi:MAG: hypothetical protein STSR0009_27290 [Methanoregula sp.]